MAQPQPIDLNILPDRYRPAQLQSSVSIAILAGAALLFGLMPAYAFVVRERNETAAVEARLDQVKAALAQSSAGAGTLESITQQIDQIRERIAQLEAQLETVGEGSPSRSEAIAAIAGSLAGEVEITSIQQQESNTFVVTGRAGDQTLVLDYAEALQIRTLDPETDRKFANVRILSIVDEDPLTSVVVFSIAVEQ
jgi:Tfp pilus assembly protein PilN